MKTKNKVSKRIKSTRNKLILMSLGVMGTAAIVSSCSLFIQSESTAEPIITDHKINTVPANTPYEVAHNLEFALQFMNSGGYNPDARVSNPRSYSVFGTGWLFDWQTTSDNAATSDWTGYFATNLHVAASLLNARDNSDYVRPWFPARSSLVGYDHTTKFSIAKFDNSNSSLSSTAHKSYLTSVELSVLPKTQFTATNFMNVKPSFWDSALSPYIDFAVLAITIKPETSLFENDVYNNWMVPAMQTIAKNYRTIVGSDANASLFSAYNLIANQEDKIRDKRGYIAGYPHNDDSVPAYYSSPLLATTHGSQVWTINSDTEDTSYDGQSFDVNNASNLIPEGVNFVPYGLYFANISVNWNQKYRNQNYRQYGIGYVIENSNLSGGSSGSALFDQTNKIMGIYSGSFSHGKNNLESSFGIAQSLIVPSFENSTLNSYGLYPYNLISGTTNDYPQQVHSYFLSLGSIKTHWFNN